MRISFIIILFFPLLTFAQKADTYQIRTIAFYNLENLFDTKNDSLIYDNDRTPEGKDNWTEERYLKKIEHMSKVISEIGSADNKTAPDVVGVCEVENLNVLEDLIHHENLSKYNYGIIHFDSPDERGIDVALLYKKNAFVPVNFNSHRLLLFNLEGKRDYTRDQLIVEGLLDNEKIYFMVNHWPSRSGGEARSRPFRLEAAKLNKRIIDSVQRQNAKAKIISMGDFNDDPIDPSFKKILQVEKNYNNLDSLSLYGPMEKLYKKGRGSLAYRDKWNLFDQLYMTSTLINKERESYSYWKVGIFSPSYLMDPKGKYKGYPLRTYAGGSYVGGYSDHLPVYLHLIKKQN
ncbi:endonuclease/exonuclease/phosphatase family protein [Maribacter sp. SA7]|uniref:endonuclease/exonuclease/phosphatase family protein n=1 Tax=Maribacter zhoushanensis TaxID=3030012 RepID=UPI0023EC07A9|nr:endonuclease/exonuclease/phosphatase family protein [Maribacter zhoushanensis]MDF4203505.1 endonuclease/exonuclease/phosphatase family protein [Maribacter zhoushanensis]